MSVGLLAAVPVADRLRPNGRLGFGFGRRFFLLLSLGGLWIIPAFWSPHFLYAVALWNFILLFAWFADAFWNLPRPEEIAVERIWPQAPALQSRTQSHLRVVNEGRSAIHFTVVDDLPYGLREGEGQASGHAASHGEVTLSFPIYPTERGDKKAERVYLKYESSLSFAQRWATADVPQIVRVFPQMDALRHNSLYLTRSRRLELERRLLRQRGTGREFESLREYREGDELRDVCWSATARRGKLVTKLHQMERSQPIWILVDAGRLLRTQVGELTKLDYIANTALSVAQLALQSGDKVGMIAYGRGIQQHIPLGRGSAHSRQILNAMAQVKTEIPEADHLHAAAVLQRTQRRRSLVIWMTDLAETAMTPEVVEAATLVMRRHLVLFVVVGQPELTALANARPETMRQLYESAAAQELVQRRDLLLARLRERGALTLEVAPGELNTRVLNEYLRVKDQALL